VNDRPHPSSARIFVQVTGQEEKTLSLADIIDECIKKTNKKAKILKIHMKIKIKKKI